MISRGSTPEAACGKVRCRRVSKPVLSAVLALLVVAGARGVMLTRGAESAPPAIPKLAPVEYSPSDAVPSRLVGMASCTISACHGHTSAAPVRNGGPLLNQMDRWLADPHANAYRVLLEPVSQDILERLGVMQNGTVPPASEAAFAVHWQNCLGCHTTAGASEGQELEAMSLGEVGCEACHGPAGVWRHDHYRNGFRDVPWEQRQNRGMRNTKDLVARADMCVRCHVGHEGGDVTHDLIAAGHPVLKFELSSYLRRLPTHWNIESETARDGSPDDYQLRVWLAGQFAAAQAALDQLSRRSDGHSIWPELSEQECAACHHDLSAGNAWRRERGFVVAAVPGEPADAGRKILVPWREWNLGLLEVMLRDDQADAGETADALAELRAVMHSSLRPSPEAVASAANEAARSLREWRLGRTATKAPPYGLDVRRLQEDVLPIAAGQLRAVEDRDLADQIYYAAVAGLRDRHTPPMSVEQLKRLLLEPADTPPTERRDEFIQLINSLSD